MPKDMFVVENSSNVANVEYDADTEVMTVKYKNNRSYDYHDVPPEVFADIQKAESVGTYLAENVKGKFSTKPIEEEKTDGEENKDPGRGTDEITGEQLPDDEQTDTADDTEDAPENTDADEGVNEPAPDDEEQAPEPTSGEDTPDTDAGADNPADDAEKEGSLEGDEEQTGEGSTDKSPDEQGVDDKSGGADTGGQDSKPSAKSNDGGNAVEQDPPTKKQSDNLNLLRSKLTKLGVDMQYERGEHKTGEKFWNIKTNVEKRTRTLHETYQISENCTKSEIEEAVIDITRCFVVAD